MHIQSPFYASRGLFSLPADKSVVKIPEAQNFAIGDQALSAFLSDFSRKKQSAVFLSAQLTIFQFRVIMIIIIIM